MKPEILVKCKLVAGCKKLVIMNPFDSTAKKQDRPAKAGLPPPPCDPSGFSHPGGGPMDLAGGLVNCPMPGDLEGIVRIAAEHNYSDVHLGVGEAPRFRFRGDIIRTGWPVTDATTFGRWTEEMVGMSMLESFRRKKEFDGSHAFPFVRVRINLMDSLRGLAMVLRLIPNRIASLEELCLPPVLRQLCTRPKGLVLVTGPTGSGKTTTLAAMVDWINCHMCRHILTIEDPVEFVHQSQQSLIRHREVGLNSRSFHSALRSALREDPDVILIGEIRDQETLATAIQANQTGHLVFGTMHTNSAVRTVERVLGMFPPSDQEAVRRGLSDSLLGIVAQGLIKTTDGKRTAFHDILINNDACRDYIQRGQLDAIEQIMERSSFEGMQTINQALLKLAQEGRIEAGDALAQSLKPAELKQALRGRQ